MSSAKFQIGEIVWYTPGTLFAYEKKILATRDEDTSDIEYLISDLCANEIPQWTPAKKLTKKAE